ncbi:CGNR zinc finger domain-containing protein [Planotetraspora sp. A-T 1434]|uniref:CGNR zinc finger domain-containing protein n=1 Tax=Planotetraspora sp. A-T 1434 TaxID=2979219 RepID=UPI0021BE3D93|nr:CGNR zinc finger domain-containing protein [Planotetraspora sp. A-T 1434]MCT9934466.1 CGNR zinc finger domain-containing protein [Planotetraspora sp. A-T 1434]
MEHAFPCGNPALDFVGTLRARRNAAPLEMLKSARSLDAWFRESGVVDGDTNCQPSDVSQAVTLREAIYSLIAARLADESFNESALSLVNRAARTPSTIPQLTSAGRRIEATPEQAMSSVARTAIDILSGPEALLLRECGRPGCTQVYMDRSRGSRREWCGTKCRNKVNAAAYRARRRES